MVNVEHTMRPWYRRGCLFLVVAAHVLLGCAAEEVRQPITPARITVQSLTRVDEIRNRADRILDEMRYTQEELKRRLPLSGGLSAACPLEAIPRVDVIVTDALVKREGLRIPPEKLSHGGDLGPYKTDFGAIAEAGEQVKDIGLKCGVGPPVPPPPRNPAPLVVTGIGAGLGAAGLVVGGVLGQMALEKKEELDHLCVNKKCPPDAKSIADSKDSLATGSTIAFVAGGSILVLSGIPLIVYFAPRTTNSPQTSFLIYSGRF